jgi:hypothetical protein
LALDGVHLHKRLLVHAGLGCKLWPAADEHLGQQQCADND